MKARDIKILVLRLSAIGDVVRVIPAVEALKRALPDAQFDWVVEEKSADVVTGHHALNDVVIFRRRVGTRAFLQLLREMRSRQYDIVVDFHGIAKSGLIALASGANERYGFARPRSQEGSAFCMNHRVVVPRDALNRVEENFRLAESVAPIQRKFSATIAVPEEVGREVDRFVEEKLDSDKRTIIVHAPVDRKEKQWPLSHFSALCERLLVDGRFNVVLTWGPGQRAIAEEVAKGVTKEAIIAPDWPSLKQYAALARAAGLYFGGDTGPMHIASAMGTPVVAVFGGTHPRQHEPAFSSTRILFGDGEEYPRLTPAQRLEKIGPHTAYQACADLVFGESAGGV